MLSRPVLEAEMSAAAIYLVIMQCVPAGIHAVSPLVP